MSNSAQPGLPFVAPSDEFVRAPQAPGGEATARPLRLAIERQGNGDIFLIAFDLLTRDTVNGQEGVIASVLTRKSEHATQIVTAVNAWDNPALLRARADELEG